MATKLGTMVIYVDGLLPIKLLDPLLILFYFSFTIAPKYEWHSSLINTK